MKHDEWKEKVALLLYGELGSEEQHSVESHLAECQVCRDELAQLQRLHSLVTLGKPAKPNTRLIMEARQNLRAILRYERSRLSVWQRVVRWLSERTTALSPALYPRTSMALGSALLFAGGVLVGLYGFKVPLAVVGVAGIGSEVSDVFSGTDTDITNVQFVDSDATDGSVEFVFDAVRAIHVKGAIEDPRVQKVLAYAVVNDQNPGVRLRAINTVGEFAPPKGESEIKRALVIALKSDPNTGVRKEAYTALMKYPFDGDIKQALIHVLTHDENPAMRIEAIERLESSLQSSDRSDRELVNVFKARMENDENTFIRERARTVIEGLSNP